MRRVTAILSVAAVVLMAAGLVAQAKPSFAGEWKMVAPGGGQGEPGVDLIITQGATAMTVEYMRGGQLPHGLTARTRVVPSRHRAEPRLDGCRAEAATSRSVLWLLGSGSARTLARIGHRGTPRGAPTRYWHDCLTAVRPWA
jgi:hypothetical protein